MSDKQYFYWFSSEDGTSEYQRIPAEIGRTDSCEGEIVPCSNGLHASPTPFDALQYADGCILWRVELSDERVSHGQPIDKYAARSRTYVSKINSMRIMRIFASKQALSLIHLWSAPDVVREYLTDEAAGNDRSDIRAAALDAARDAAKTQFNEMCYAEFGT